MIFGEDFWVQDAYRRVKDLYSKTVFLKGKALLKFGQNENVGTTECTIMQFLGSETSETYVETNLITKVVTDNAGNTGQVTIEGHSISGTDKTFVIQTATLTGQTAVTLTTPLCRVTRVYNSSSADLVASSKVYVYEGSDTVSSGVPQTASKTHCIMDAIENTSLKGATCFSSVDWGFITQVYFTIDKKTSASADVRLKIRESGKVFRTVFKRSISTTGKQDIDFPLRPFIIVPANADVILTATASTTGVSISGGFNTLIAITNGQGLSL